MNESKRPRLGSDPTKVVKSDYTTSEVMGDKIMSSDSSAVVGTGNVEDEDDNQTSSAGDEDKNAILSTEDEEEMKPGALIVKTNTHIGKLRMKKRTLLGAMMMKTKTLLGWSIEDEDDDGNTTS
ncbi:hypothetical protein Tco_1404116 [Tanacetum coccineum]